MKKTVLFLTLCISLPVLLGAGTSEEVRRIEEEKRKKLHSSEATLERRQMPLPKEKPSIERTIFDRLLDKDMVTVKDGVELVQLLTEEKVEALDADHEPLTRGRLGQMICRALDVKGGLTMRIFGNKRRYAHKELVHMGIMFPGSSREYISGKELIVSIIQAIDYMTQASDE